MRFMRRMRWLTFLFFLLLLSLLFRSAMSETNMARRCVGGRSGEFSCNHVTLQAQVPLNGFSSRPRSASNLWGYVDLDDHREYAIVGLSNGTAVVDVTRPTVPRVVGIVPAISSLWREVKVYSFQNT